MNTQLTNKYGTAVVQDNMQFDIIRDQHRIISPPSKMRPGDLMLMLQQEEPIGPKVIFEMVPVKSVKQF